MPLPPTTPHVPCVEGMNYEEMVPVLGLKAQRNVPILRTCQVATTKLTAATERTSEEAKAVLV